MVIRCWGARGSIPVSGAPYQKTGGDTSCIEIRDRDELLIFDAGTGIRALGEKLGREKERHIHLLMTHAHWDHLVGFPFFQPIYSKDARLDIYGPALLGEPFRTWLMSFMKPPYFPITLDAIQAGLTFHEIGDHAFEIGEFTIHPVQLNHPDGGVGYKILNRNKTVVFLTDNELDLTENAQFSGSIQQLVRGADLLIHDAMYISSEYQEFQGWGHSRCEDVIDLAIRADINKLGLYHHHQNRTDRDFESIMSACQHQIREAGSDLECFVMHQGWEMQL